MTPRRRARPRRSREARSDSRRGRRHRPVVGHRLAGRAPALLLAGALALGAACSATGADPDALPEKPGAAGDEPADDPADQTGSSGETAPSGSDPDGDRSATTDRAEGADTDDAGADTDDAVDGDAGEPADGFEPQPVDWGACEEGTGPEYECGTLTVPLDHDEPGGETIDLALIRAPATGDREGAVLVNPGGPGGSGVDTVASVGTFIAQELDLADFDVVGFDPRGVDRSNGLRCLTDAELDAALYPDDPDEEFDDAEFADACEEAYGDTLGEYSTENTARDMDLMREAFGDDTISYLGISYGTYLGAVYATLFPDRVRAMVLDSGFEPTDDTTEQQLTTQLVGFEDAFDNWAADCAADPDCPFAAGDDEDVGDAWDELEDRLDDDPLVAEDGRTVSGDVVEQATIAALYDELTWSTLSEALAMAADGDPSGLLGLSDRYHQRDGDGTYATLRQSSSVIRCASGLEPEVPEDPDALAARVREVAPRFGDDVDADDLDSDCDELLAPVDPPALDYDGEAPILVVGGLNDPATPFRWSEELASALGPSAVLVTWTGEGHGQLLMSECLRDLASMVLADLESPDPDTTCEPDPPAPEPAWWVDVPVLDELRGPLPEGALAVLGVRPTDAFAEAYATSVDQDSLFDAYQDELADAGFEPLGEQEPVPGITTLGALVPGGDVLVVAVVDPAVGGADLEPVADLVDDGELVVLLFAQPA